MSVDWASGREAPPLRGAGATRRLEAPLLAAIPGVAHGFTVRGTDPRALLDGLVDGAPAVSLRQVHGAVVQVVPPLPREGERRAGDALATRGAGAVLVVWVADCVPILLCDARTRALAAVHAGWRGTVAGVVGAAMATLRDRFGTRPADLRMAMGPAIGPCCFEVGDEVPRALLEAHPGSRSCVLPGPRARVDLHAANRLQAITAGVLLENIQALPLCTACRPDLLESYRRDREAAGRMAGFIGWRG